jgi:hypothetical protein
MRAGFSHDFEQFGHFNVSIRRSNSNMRGTILEMYSRSSRV